MFLPDRQCLQIYLYRKPVDMRKQRTGLAALVKSVLQLDPYSGALFVFIGRRRDRVRILYWDKSGFATWYKVLETREKYPWLRRSDVDSVTLTADELEWLLDGYDVWKMKKHREVRFSHVSG